MVHSMKKIKVIILFFIIICFCLILFFKDVNFETNLVKTILPSNLNNLTDIIDITDKSSSIIKAVFEGGEKQKENFIKQLDFEVFELNQIDFSKYLNAYTKSSSNFLSDRDKLLLENKRYEDIYNNALNELYNPLSVQILPFEKDPYFLLQNFLFSNKIQKDKDNDLISIEFGIKNRQGLSPDIINKEIKKLVNIQKKLSNSKEKIYLSGVPVHSYYTSRNTVISINIISFLSLLLILIITYFYFKDMKIVFPVILSISLGLLAGICAVKLCFSNFQVVTMVFSGAVIGLGIDYSFHYLFHLKRDKIFIKKLTFSLASTIIPFLFFYLTGIELLKQIAVFSAAGLTAIYFFVIFYYPLFDFPLPVKHIKINNKTIKLIFALIAVFAFMGVLKLNFNDSLSAFYIPSKKLLMAEKMYNQTAGTGNSSAQIISITGKNTEEILQKEEKTAVKLKEENIEYAAISKFFPSEKKQIENFNLIKKLYKKNLKEYNNILSAKQIKKLRNEKFNVLKAPYINEFMLNENNSLMFVFSEKKLEISNDGVKVINIRQNIENYLKNYRYKILKIFPYMMFALFILLCLFFGIKNGSKIFLPSFVGMFMSVGLTSFITGELNLFTLISLFLVLGFTIDYSVFNSEAGEKIEDSVLISCITTAFSFLLLSFTSFKLISSIALVLFFGIIVSYLYSTIIFKKDV